MSSYQLGRAAEGFLLAGDRDAAHALLEEAFTAQAKSGESWGHAALLGLKGELQAANRQAEQAEQSFRDALTVARGRGAKWFGLRAATRLAQYWLSRGRNQAAYDLLKPVFDSLSEGLTTFELPRPCSLAKVEHRKVTFKNRYGIELAADLYIPKERSGQPLAALAISGPFGAVKEQASGLYAHIRLYFRAPLLVQIMRQEHSFHPSQS